MSHDPLSPITPSNPMDSQKSAQMRANRQASDLRILQTSMKKLATEYTEQFQFNLMSLLRNAEPLEKRIKRSDFAASKAMQEDEENIVQVDAVTKTAEEFQDRNPEMQKRALLSLKKAILASDTPEQILEKILLSYPDHFLADEALEFLSDTSDPGTEIGSNLRKARDLLNERYGREVRAGRNINNDAREFSKQGLGTPSALRDLYRDITGNPKEALTLFEELSQSFNFEKMKPIIQFMLHSLGSDLKSKGPSIEPAELQRLFTETRTMQAILGIYRFFFQRMPLIEGQFQRELLPLPQHITFEALAKLFVKLISERYPAPEKVLKLIGLSDSLLAQIIILTQFRDAMRGVAPRLFKSEKQRQDLLMVLIETISELDDLLEEEEEKEEKKPGWSEEDTIE